MLAAGSADLPHSRAAHAVWGGREHESGGGRAAAGGGWDNAGAFQAAQRGAEERAGVGQPCPLRARLEPRVVRDMAVYVGTRRGYSIAAAEQRGVGYAAATDLDDAETAELIASTVVH